MTDSDQVGSASFWSDFERYLRFFSDNLLPSKGVVDFPIGSLWSRTGEGGLELTRDESQRYHQLVQSACMAFTPGEDISKAVISEAAMDAALKDAIFTVADISRVRDSDLEVRIRQALDQFRSFVGGSNLEYECWIEVDGLNDDSLPARFGGTVFVIWGDTEFDALKADMEDMPSVDEGMRPVHLDHIDEELWGKPVAIQRVWARDSQAAYLLAEREVQATLECLNFFADVVPYNRAHLRVAHGMYSKRYALQVSRAHGSGFRYTERAVNPWRFSVNRLRESRALPVKPSSELRRSSARLTAAR